MTPLALLRQRLRFGGGPFVGERAFILGPAVVDRTDLFAGRDTGKFSPPEYGDYLATSSAIYAVVRLRYTLLSSVPLKLYTGPADNRTEVESGEARDLFDRVNPFWTWARLIQMTEASLCLWGKNFWFIERNGRGRPQNIWWARPDRVEVVQDARNYVSHFLYRPVNGERDIRFEVNETVWVRTPNPLDEFEGLSPVAAARLSADTANAAMHSNRNLFTNGIQAGGFVMPKGPTPWTKEQRAAIQDGLNREHKGVRNAHRWGVFSHEITMQSVAMSPKDAEFLGALGWTLEDICRSFGVPLDLLGGQRTYANVEASERIVWTFTIRPEAQFLAAEINEQLMPMFGVRGLAAEFDFSDVEVLKEAETDAWARAESQIRNGAITRNEWRKMQNLPPVAWGDVWWAPTAGGGLAPVVGPNAPLALNAAFTSGALTINEWRQQNGMPAVPWGDAWWAPLNVVPISDSAQAQPPEPAVTVTELPNQETPALPPGETDVEAEVETGPRRRARTIVYGSPEHMQRWRAFVRWTEPWERRFGVMAADQFRELRRAVIAKLKQSARSAADAAESPFNKGAWITRFKVAARPLLMEIVAEAGQRALDDLFLDLSFDVSDPNMAAFIERREQRFARPVVETTWNELRASLAEGIERGESIPDLTARVEEVMNGRIRSSGEVIARTEVLGASNGGTLLSWKQSGVVQGKRWLAALDERTRETHVAAHNQTVGLDQDFDVGSGSGPAPGQIGLASEDVNCRCSMTAVLDVEEMPRAGNGHGTTRELDALVAMLGGQT